MTDELSTVGLVIGWAVSVLGTGLGTGWLATRLQRRHEIRLRARDRKHAIALQVKQNESNMLLQDGKHRAETEVERLRSQLEQERSGYATVHRMAAEREFQCYSAIWERLMNLMEILNRQPGPTHPDVQKWNADVTETRAAFIRCYRDSRPFYAENVFQACLTLNNSASFVQVTDRFGENFHIAEQRRSAIDVIDAEVVNIASAIRLRIGQQLSLIPGAEP